MHTVGTGPAGYTIVTSIMLVGFLLVLTTGTLTLVMQEMQDGRGQQNYMKAYAGAEGAMELALYDIKQYGYGYDGEQVDLDVLGEERTDAILSYEFDITTNDYTSTLGAFQTEIIPLFWLSENDSGSVVSEIDFSPDDSNIVWNIIGESAGMSGVGGFNQGTSLKYRSAENSLENTSIGNFLASSGKSFLILYNPTGSEIGFTLTSAGEDESFSKPKAFIYASAEVGKYTQNIKTTIDNTEFLGMLRYSIYSGN